MTSRAHLTPATITDRRGRTTTVYRNLNATGAPGSGAQIPTLPPVAASVTVTGPLREPSKRSRAEMAEFLQPANRSKLSRPVPVAGILRSPEGRSATALAMDFAADGTLDPKDAHLILTGAHPEDGTTLPLDALRVAAHLRPRSADLTSSDPRGLKWSVQVLQAVRGSRSPLAGGDEQPISSQRDLDAVSAVAEFVLRVGPRTKGDLVFSTSMRKSRDRMDHAERITSPALSQLVRDRPADVERITAYVTEHGFDDRDPEDLNRLRGHLDGITSPLTGGWL